MSHLSRRLVSGCLGSGGGVLAAVKEVQEKVQVADSLVSLLERLLAAGKGEMRDRVDWLQFGHHVGGLLVDGQTSLCPTATHWQHILCLHADFADAHLRYCPPLVVRQLAAGLTDYFELRLLEAPYRLTCMVATRIDWRRRETL